MIGILIISHEQLGTSLIDCIIHILGERPPLLVNHIVSSAEGPDSGLVRLQATLKQLDQGGGVLILTDIFGATPSNIARNLIRSGRVECLAGLNLPMLLRAVQYRHQPLPQLIDKVLAGGRESIFQISPENSNAN
ncbi:MAG: PTS system fructose-specific EIIA component [Nitrosomonas europaea]|uniref:PTS sugar transporter subunit IIA n=1 Tax=Nitrosomonas europaea TaxID=915 RepID=UPI0023F503E8|nr:PTS fructose transporter subunit IIA [Nitrosomonas europaea]MBV6389959.1 PTS system fructose-specific EIIA component [Nitrosomonas europaea]